MAIGVRAEPASVVCLTAAHVQTPRRCI